MIAHAAGQISTVTAVPLTMSPAETRSEDRAIPHAPQPHPAPTVWPPPRHDGPARTHVSRRFACSTVPQQSRRSRQHRNNPLTSPRIAIEAPQGRRPIDRGWRTGRQSPARRVAANRRVSPEVAVTTRHAGTGHNNTDRLGRACGGVLLEVLITVISIFPPIIMARAICFRQHPPITASGGR